MRTTMWNFRSEWTKKIAPYLFSPVSLISRLRSFIFIDHHSLAYCDFQLHLAYTNCLNLASNIHNLNWQKINHCHFQQPFNQFSLYKIWTWTICEQNIRLILELSFNVALPCCVACTSMWPLQNAYFQIKWSSTVCKLIRKFQEVYIHGQRSSVNTCFLYPVKRLVFILPNYIDQHDIRDRE